MIKTESGEMIDPRVGDVCRSTNFTPAIHRCEIYKIKESTSIYFIQVKLPDGQIWDIEARQLMLLHRHFKVGDELEAWSHGSDCWMFWGTILNGQHLNGCNLKYFRHKNPAWRPHSEWKSDENPS